MQTILFHMDYNRLWSMLECLILNSHIVLMVRALLNMIFLRGKNEHSG